MFQNPALHLARVALWVNLAWTVLVIIVHVEPIKTRMGKPHANSAIPDSIRITKDPIAHLIVCAVLRIVVSGVNSTAQAAWSARNVFINIITFICSPKVTMGNIRVGIGKAR